MSEAEAGTIDAGRDIAALARCIAGLRPEDADAVSSADLQDVLAAIIKIYAARSQAGDRFPPFTDETVAPTEVLIMASALMKAANVALFELGMWQAWAGPNS